MLDKKTGEIEHLKFANIIDFLDENDVLVINDTKVLPARLHGVKEDTNAYIEVLLLNDINYDNWKCLVKPAKRVKVGTVVKFSDKLKFRLFG